MSNISRLLVLLLVCSLTTLNAQQIFRSLPAGGNKKATVSEWVGITTVEISYGRPGVKGREGKIWGQVVHYGFADLDYGTSKAAPWRAGANENTTISFSSDVLIEDKPLPAGKYGFFIAMGPDKATLIFSKYNTAWGSFYYNPKDDALRVDVPVVKTNEGVEWLTYTFSDQTDNSAVVSLVWEKIKIPFKVSVDFQKDQLTEFRRAINAGEFHGYWQNMQREANFCLVNNVNLEEGLTWADRSINTYFGESNFLTLSTSAGLLEKLGKKKQADSIMVVAIPKATVIQMSTYARNLLRQKRNKEAFDISKLNYDKNPGNEYAVIGMVRAYFALGNKDEAIKYADKAKNMLKDLNSKAYMDNMILDIKNGKDINK
jgi:hypothetical protein